MKMKALVLLALGFAQNAMACDYSYQSQQIIYTPTQQVIARGNFTENQSFACIDHSLAVIEKQVSLAGAQLFSTSLSVFKSGKLQFQQDLSAIGSNYLSDKIFLESQGPEFRVFSRFEFAGLENDKLELFYDADGNYLRGKILQQTPKGCANFYFDELSMKVFSIADGTSYPLISDKLLAKLKNDYLNVIPETMRGDDDQINFDISMGKIICRPEAIAWISHVSFKHKKLNKILTSAPVSFLSSSNGQFNSADYDGEFANLYERWDGNILAYQINSPVIKVFDISGKSFGEIDPSQK